MPINFRRWPEEVACIAANSGTRVLYVDPELVDSLHGIDVEHMSTLGEDADMLAKPGPLRDGKGVIAVLRREIWTRFFLRPNLARRAALTSSGTAAGFRLARLRGLLRFLGHRA